MVNTEEQAREWLRKKCHIYELKGDITWDPEQNSLNVPGAVLVAAGVTHLGVQFGEVDVFVACREMQSLVGSPRMVREFTASESEIRNLEGGPQSAITYYVQSCRNLKSLRGGPSECKEFSCNYSHFESWDWDPNGVRELNLTAWRDTPIVRALCAKSVHLTSSFDFGPRQMKVLRGIMQDERLIGKGKLGAIPCAAALIKAGFGGNARW